MTKQMHKPRNLITTFCLIFICGICSQLSLGNTSNEIEYLLHTNKNIARLKEQIKKNDEVKHAWESQLEKANQLVKRDRLGAADCQELSLAYRVTGETKYAEAIKKILLDYTNRETWEDRDLLNRTPPWRGGLGTSHTSFYIAMGYNAAYGYLSANEKQKIAHGIVNVGIKPAMEDWLNPESNFHALDNMGHNWWSACVYMAGFASLAVKNEIPEAASWAKDIALTIHEWIHYNGSVLQNKPSNFDKDGGFYESINYATYGFSQYLLFRYAMVNVMPGFMQPEVPMMEKMVYFFIQTTYYSGEGPLSVNFGDGSMDRNGNACLVLLWNLGIQNKNMAWYLDQTNHGNDKEGIELNSPVGLILNPDLPELDRNFLPDLSTSHLFADMGWAVMRDTWKNDATFVAVKSGFTWNHSHADNNSFIVFHDGKYLIIDSGNSSYGNPLYTRYYCQSEAHNVVLFNGKAQNPGDPYFGVVNHGSLHNLVAGDHFKYLLADATGPTSQYFARNYRNFLWIGDVVLVIDDLLAHETGKFEWLLHYNGVSKRRGKDLAIKDGDAGLIVRPLFPETFPDGGLPHDFPEQMWLEEKSGYKDHAPDEIQKYWSISHFKETDRAKFISAIILESDENRDSLPVLERLAGENMIGVRVTQNGKVSEVYFNLLADGRLKHRNSINSFNGWETDAYLTVLTFEEGKDRGNPENLKQLFIGHGSYLRKDDQVISHALSKYFMLVDYRKEMPVIEFQGQPFVNLLVYENSGSREIVLNKKNTKGSHIKEKNVLQIKIDDH